MSFNGHNNLCPLNSAPWTLSFRYSFAHLPYLLDNKKLLNNTNDNYVCIGIYIHTCIPPYIHTYIYMYKKCHWVMKCHPKWLNEINFYCNNFYFCIFCCLPLFLVWIGCGESWQQQRQTEVSKKDMNHLELFSFIWIVILFFFFPLSLRSNSDMHIPLVQNIEGSTSM